MWTEGSEVPRPLPFFLNRASRHLPHLRPCVAPRPELWARKTRVWDVYYVSPPLFFAPYPAPVGLRNLKITWSCSLASQKGN